MNIRSYLFSNVYKSKSVVSDHVEKYSHVLKELKAEDIIHDSNCHRIAHKIRYGNDSSSSEMFQKTFIHNVPDIESFMLKTEPVIDSLHIQTLDNRANYLYDLSENTQIYPVWLLKHKEKNTYDTTLLYNKLLNCVDIEKINELKMIENSLEMYNTATSLLLDPSISLLVGFQTFTIFGYLFHKENVHQKLIKSLIANINSRSYINIVKSYKLLAGFIFNSTISFCSGVLVTRYVLTTENPYIFKGEIGRYIQVFTELSTKTVYNVFNVLSKIRSSAFLGLFEPVFDSVVIYADKITKKYGS